MIRTAILLVAAAFGAQSATHNVVVVMTDGLRWQEVFEGADASLMTKENGKVSRPEELKRQYWRETPADRRVALMPFFWNVIGKQGQIYGNRKRGSEAYVTNGKNFSYPGYSETLCGFADPRIDSNKKIPNPNVTVLEWLHGRPGFRGRVASFGAWDVIGAVVNGERAGFVSNAAYEPLSALPRNEKIALLNRLKVETKYLEGEPFDSFTFHTALEYLKSEKPRVLYLSLGETDEWAHAGDYERYLHAAHRVDAYLKELWDTIQAMDSHRGRTSLVLVTDHGRGEAPVDWKGHGEKIPDSKYMWMAFLGPDTRPLGERIDVPAVTQSQIAATVAALLGEDYAGSQPKAAKPVQDVLPGTK